MLTQYNTILLIDNLTINEDDVTVCDEHFEVYIVTKNLVMNKEFS